ncbi:MAG: OmpA family protein, partial [Armatimonadetes bacterium]|nr:OmpA family protein [Armatimonadota bacterium]
GPETKTVTASAAGAFNLKLKPGEYNLAVTATGFLRKEQKIKVTAGGTSTVSFAMSPKPRRSLVRITRRTIEIKRKVHFATDTADIKPDSRQLLDSVVDVLLSNPQLRIEIQGHTDNRGSRQRNMVLSQARAEAVRDYLIKNGVQDARLVAKGYGPSRPKRPNITARNRAINRRVEFAILR